MPIFVKYQMQLEGLKVVERGMESIEQKAERLNRRVSKVRIGGTAGLSGGAANGNASIKEAQAIARAQEKTQEKAAREGVRIHEKAEKEKSRIAAREAQSRAREESRWANASRKMRDQHFREQERVQLRNKAQWINTTRGVVGGTARGVSSFAGGALALSGIGGAALATNALHGFMRDKAAASRLANQLAGKGSTVEEINSTKARLLENAQAVKGVDTAAVIGAQSEFQGMAGESAATMKIGGRLARAHLATGTELPDLGKMYAAIFKSIRNSAGGAEKSVEQVIEETDQMGRVLAEMGSKGAVEISNFASLLPRFAATSAAVGGGTANLADVAAIAQVTQEKTGSAEETETALHTLVADLAHNWKNAKAMGVDVFTDMGEGKKTQLRRMPEVISELMGATGGDITKLQKVANIRSMKVFSGVGEAFNQAYAGTSGTQAEKTEAGKKAVLARYEAFSAGGGYAEEDFNARQTAALSDEGKILEANWKDLNVKVGRELIPVVSQLVPEIAKLTPYVVDTARAFAAFASNPLPGIGALIGAFLIKEIASAKIGSLFAAGLNKAGTAVEGGGGGGGGGGKFLGKPGGAAMLGAGVTGLALGAMTYGAIDTTGRANFDKTKSSTDEVMKGLANVGGEDLGPALLDATEKLRAIKEDQGSFDKFMDLFGAGGGGEIKSAEVMVEQKKAEYAEFLRSGGKLNAAADAIVEAAGVLKASTGNGPTTFPNRGNTKSPVI